MNNNGTSVDEMICWWGIRQPSCILSPLMMSKQLLTNLVIFFTDKNIFLGKFCLSVIIGIWVTKISMFHFSAFFHGSHLHNDYLDHIACDLLLTTCFIWKCMKKSIENIDFRQFCGGCPNGPFTSLTCIFRNPFDLSAPKRVPFHK